MASGSGGSAAPKVAAVPLTDPWDALPPPCSDGVIRFRGFECELPVDLPPGWTWAPDSVQGTYALVQEQDLWQGGAPPSGPAPPGPAEPSAAFLRASPPPDGRPRPTEAAPRERAMAARLAEAARAEGPASGGLTDTARRRAALMMLMMTMMIMSMMMMRMMMMSMMTMMMMRPVVLVSHHHHHHRHPQRLIRSHFGSSHLGANPLQRLPAQGARHGLASRRRGSHEIWLRGECGAKSRKGRRASQWRPRSRASQWRPTRSRASQWRMRCCAIIVSPPYEYRTFPTFS